MEVIRSYIYFINSSLFMFSAAWWMVLASLIFCIMSINVKLSLLFVSLSFVVIARSCFGIFSLGSWALLSKKTFYSPHWKNHMIRGLSGALSLTLWFWGISTTGLAASTTLNYTSPFFMLLLVRKEIKISPLMIMLFVMAFFGVYLLFGLTGLEPIGLIAGLGSGLLSAIAYSQIRQLGAKGEEDWRTVFYFSLTATFFGIALLFLEWNNIITTLSKYLPQQSILNLNLESLGYLALTGLCATIAQLCLTRAYSQGKTLLVTNLQYSGVIFAVIADYLLKGTALTVYGYCGIFFIICSAIGVSWLQNKN